MILDYVTHQRRLFPALATTYAMHLAMLSLKQLAVRGGGNGNGAEGAKQVRCASALAQILPAHRARECCARQPAVLMAHRLTVLLCRGHNC